MPRTQSKPITLKDAEGRTRLSIGLDETGSPQIQFFDEDAQARLRLELQKDGVGTIAVKDRAGKLAGVFGERGMALTDGFKVSPVPGTTGGVVMTLGKVAVSGIANQLYIGAPGVPTVDIFAFSGNVQILDDQNTPRMRLHLDDGDTFLLLKDGDSEKAVAIGINKDDGQASEFSCTRRQTSRK